MESMVIPGKVTKVSLITDGKGVTKKQIVLDVSVGYEGSLEPLSGQYVSAQFVERWPSSFSTNGRGRQSTLDEAVAQDGEAPTETCPRCEGCGEVGDDERQRPWTRVQQEEPAAVEAGEITATDCPDCGGTGTFTPVAATADAGPTSMTWWAEDGSDRPTLHLLRSNVDGAWRTLCDQDLEPVLSEADVRDSSALLEEQPLRCESCGSIFDAAIVKQPETVWVGQAQEPSEFPPFAPDDRTEDGGQESAEELVGPSVLTGRKRERKFADVLAGMPPEAAG